MTLRIVLPLALIALASGCNFKTHGVPAMKPKPAMADYTILGKTNHEECGTYIFAIDWGHLFSNQKTSIEASSTGFNPLALLMGGKVREESRALYHALDKMPEATHLLANRSHTTATGLVMFGTPFFGERCVSVEAHGVKIGDKPFPAQVNAQ